MDSNRTPVRWLNYPSDVRGMVGQVVGPNTMGEYLTAVTEDYDEATNVTRVGFVFGRVEVSA
jgi:hypothetical protein